MIIIDYDKCCWKNGACSKCGCSSGNFSGNCCDGCAEACPTEAITRADKLIIDQDLCIECNVCIEACEHGALTEG